MRKIDDKQLNVASSDCTADLIAVLLFRVLR